MSSKTNAVRILDQLHISYDLLTYEVSEDDLSAVHVAETAGIPLEKLYKTLVLKGSSDPYMVAVIPADSQLNLKKLAKASGNKNCELIAMKDLLAVTGYVRGGCSPIGMKKTFPTFIEEMATLEESICISAGKRGLQILLNPTDLGTVVNAKFTDISD